ncbi:hypothetical protein B0T11DRAFT_321595, partial [Plectosphaerella cucumerina]
MNGFGTSQSLLTACDLCHIRKVRCDRQDPCDRCTGTASRCVRTRQIYQTRRKRRAWLSKASENEVQNSCSSASAPDESIQVRPSLSKGDNGPRHQVEDSGREK